MKAVMGTLKVAFGVATLAAVVVATSSAQCVGSSVYRPSALMLRQPFPGGHVGLAMGASAFHNAVDGARAAEQEPVVGFWSVEFIAHGDKGIPDGTVIDSGYSQWHSDGTEILNSSRPPSTESFCLGVWEKTGASQYRLNHFAISWKANGTELGPANIREQITVGPDHNHFTGTFTIDQYDTAGTLVSHVAGRIEGKRITLKTTVKDML